MIRHMGMTPAYMREYLRDRQRRGETQDTVSDDDGPVTYEAAFAFLDDLTARGFEVVPTCDNADESTGRCLGHER